MGGVRCAKEVIDNGAAVQRQATCTMASVLLAKAEAGWEPGEKITEEARALGEAYALKLAEIEKQASEALG